MAQVVEVQFHPWDQGYYFDSGGNSYLPGDRVLVRTDLGLDLGVVISVKEVNEEEITTPLKPVQHKATAEDMEKMREQQKLREQALSKCRELIKKYQLEMRLVDCAFSFDGGRITFVFTAPSRVDFRNLLKDLNHAFQKSIRLQQIGVRDAAKYIGGVGVCGRGLCCSAFLCTLGSISTDLARLQEIDQRGTDRLLGSCGRLRCCLRFEAEMYPGYREAVVADEETPQLVNDEESNEDKK